MCHPSKCVSLAIAVNIAVSPKRRYPPSSMGLVYWIVGDVRSTVIILGSVTVVFPKPSVILLHRYRTCSRKFGTACVPVWLMPVSVKNMVF